MSRWPALIPRLESRVRVDPVTGCWRWLGTINQDGYAHVYALGRTRRAHILFYELFVGPVPEGLDLDHVAARGCLYRDCVNPEHLEPVTRRENNRRGKLGRGENANAAKTACVHGHHFTEANTYMHTGGKRGCRTCRNAAQRRYGQGRRSRS